MTSSHPKTLLEIRDESVKNALKTYLVGFNCPDVGMGEVVEALALKVWQDCALEYEKRVDGLVSALEKIQEDSQKYHIACNEYGDDFDPYGIATEALKSWKDDECEK